MLKVVMNSQEDLRQIRAVTRSKLDTFMENKDVDEQLRSRLREFRQDIKS